MKILLSLLTVLLSLSAFGQQGVSMRATNGVGFGVTTFNGPINATNTSITNVFAGKIQGQGGVAQGSGSVALGLNNTNGGAYSLTTGIGNRNTGSGALVGGQGNVVSSSAQHSIVGGTYNAAAGAGNFVIGTSNTIEGDFSAAVGKSIRAEASTHRFVGMGQNISVLVGTSNLFVWNSSPTNDVTPTVSDSFTVNAQGGIFLNGPTTFSTSNDYVGNFTGNGAGLNNIQDAALSANVPLKNTQNNFSASNYFAMLGVTDASAGNATVGAISGNAVGLTNIAASNIISGGVLTLTISNNAATTTPVIVVSNTVAATAGSPKASGQIRLQGSGFSTGISSSTNVEFNLQAIPTSASTAAGNLVVSNNIGGAASTEVMRISSAGIVTASTGFALTSGDFAGAPGSAVTASGRGSLDWLALGSARMRDSNGASITNVTFGTSTGGTNLWLKLTAGATPALAVVNNTNGPADFIVGGAITATNQILGASGSLMLSTNVSVAMAANTYTNVGNYDYTTVFGNVTASTDALTNGTAGRYFIAIHAAFAGAGAASLYEGAVFTNTVECTIIEWQRDVTTTFGSASASGILTLPAGCRVEYKIKSPDAETAVFAKLGLTIMGAN